MKKNVSMDQSEWKRGSKSAVSDENMVILRQGEMHNNGNSKVTDNEQVNFRYVVPAGWQGIGRDPYAHFPKILD